MRARVRSLKSPFSYQIRWREKVARTIRSKYHLTPRAREERKRCGILVERAIGRFHRAFPHSRRRVIAFSSFSSSLEFNKGRESDGGYALQSSQLFSLSRSSLPYSHLYHPHEQEPQLLSTIYESFRLL